MAKGLRDIKRQIKSVQNTKQITKAMEMVAASKLRRIQEKSASTRPYKEKLEELIQSLTSKVEISVHPMLQKREIKKTGYLVITSDRGLAGGYNSNLLRLLKNTLASKNEDYTLFVIGKKGVDYFSRRDMPMIDTITELSDSPKYLDIQTIAKQAVEYYVHNKYDALYIVYNQFVNALTQIPAIECLLPFKELPEEQTAVEYDYEPSAIDVLDKLLPKYAETLIYHSILQAKSSEFGARMTAMGSATKNADKVIGDLNLTYNRARQAAITQEITEIVAGANAQA